jgi:hypothetical protein
VRFRVNGDRLRAGESINCCDDRVLVGRILVDDRHVAFAAICLSGVSPDYQNRARRFFGDGFGNTPEQSTTQAGASDGTDNNKICFFFRSDLDEGRAGRTSCYKRVTGDV